MPESTCLHIQDRESGPIRVVELHGISVRIGRAAFCEIHLPDDRLADEACRLTRKGRSWSLIPSSCGQGPILFEGRPLSGPCPLPFDVPFRLGPYCLTLRHDVAAEPDWELYPASEPAESIDARGANEAGTGEPLVTGAAVTSAEDAPQRTGRPDSDPDRWRARWKAAEAHLKSRAVRLGAGGPRGAPSIPPEALKDDDRPAYRPPSMSPPPVERPAPSPSPPRVEPAWRPPRPDARLTVPLLGPAPWPVSEPEISRRQPRTTPSADRPVAAESASTEARIEEPESTTPGWAKPADAEAREPVGFTHPTDPPPQVVGWVEPTEVEPAESLEFDQSTDPHPDVVEWATPTDIETEHPFDSTHPPYPPLEPLDPEVDEALPPDGESSYSIGAVPDDEVVAPAPRPIAEPPRSRARAAVESPAGPARSVDRGPRRRKPPRRPRRDVEPPDSAADDRQSAPVFDAELPSVRDILATHRNSPGPRPAVARPRRTRVAVPTVAREPGQWVLPGWLALPPVGISALAIGLVACVLSWWWAMDASNAAVVTQRLLAADGSGRRRRLPEGFQPPTGRWVRTTAQHLAHWAIYTAGAEQGEDRRARDESPILTQALEVSPLNPTARLAMSQLEGAGRDGPARIRGLGLSRDSVSLAWSARRLLDSGKKPASLRLYDRAVSAAAGGGLSRSVTPRFAEDPGSRRYFYLLPSEDTVRDIVAELADREDLEFAEWSRALPRHPVVWLATARLLRERRRPEADALLDQILGDDWSAKDAGPADPRLLAARAEAHVLRSRWQEAADQYRQAIDRVDNELIRRSWWFNLADIAQRLDDEGQRQAALRAALAVHNSDDISRRVGLLQKSADAKVKTRPSYGTARAN
jgi:hypothetical protein